MLDGGAEVNVASQSLLIACGAKRLPEACLPRTLDYRGVGEAYTFGAYELPCQLTDSWGRYREEEILFYGQELRDVDLIIGNPALSKLGVVVDYGVQK
jgi:hypothetical protein